MWSIAHKAIQMGTQNNQRYLQFFIELFDTYYSQVLLLGMMCHMNSAQLYLDLNLMSKELRDKIKERIKEHGENYKINELCLDEINIGQFTTDTIKLIQKCHNIEYMTLQNCQLQSLTVLPSLPKLAILELDNNRIQAKQLQFLNSHYPALKTLGLSHNSIQKIEELKNLSNCQNLEKIYLANNPLSSTLEWLQQLPQIYEMLPQIFSVDGLDKYGNKFEDKSDYQVFSESEGEYSEGSEQSELQGDSPTKVRKK